MQKRLQKTEKKNEKAEQICKMYTSFTEANNAAWIRGLNSQEIHPNPEQMAFLQRIVDRVTVEAGEELGNIAAGAGWLLESNLLFPLVVCCGFWGSNF